MATRQKLYLEDVRQLIQELLASQDFSEERLLAFATSIHGSPFREKPKAKAKQLTMAQAKAAVLAKFNCKTVPELRKNKTFTMAMTGEDFALKTRDDWMKLYRKWVAVPQEERNQIGPTCINGIDVLENFRPWHVFGLDPNTATVDDVKAAFRELAKQHHPDAGGDPRVFERLQTMRDSVIALIS